MPAALGNHNKGLGTTGPTIGTFNATGATALWAVVGFYGTSGQTATISDSGGNTWRSGTKYSQESESNLQLFWAYDKAGGALSLSASHTISVVCDPSTCYAFLVGGGATGTVSDSSLLVGQNGSADSSMATGSVAGVSAGDLIIAAVSGSGSGGFSVSAGGVTIFESNDDDNYITGAVASRVSTDTSNASATFSGGARYRNAAIVVFKAAGGGPTPLPLYAYAQQ